MAKGTQSKQEATQKILELFPGSFVYEKEIRIPYVEDGENIQLKCTLTCAKTNVEENDDAAVPGEVNMESTSTPVESGISAPTQEEKDTVKSLLESFGL